jgi:DNA ligase-1
MMFEMPGAPSTFAERAERLAALVAGASRPQVEAAPQVRIADRAALQRRLDETVAGGGEGLMLHLASAPALNGRSDALMKLKPHLDAEAVVVGQRRGVGKYRGQVGALQVQGSDGRRFFVGSGLSDALRRDPPPVGALITYRYRDLTSTGLPRFATYLRRHEAL